MVRIPDHDQLVLHPYTDNYPSAVTLCKDFAERCHEKLVVEYQDTGGYAPFWSLLKSRTGGLPGQTDDWRGPTQFSSSIFDGNIVVVSLTAELVRLYVRPGFKKKSDSNSQLMSSCSNMIKTHMSDQQLELEVEEASSKGQTVQVIRQWDRSDESEWLSIADWISTQCGRLHAIVEESFQQTSDSHHAA